MKKWLAQPYEDILNEDSSSMSDEDWQQVQRNIWAETEMDPMIEAIYYYFFDAYSYGAALEDFLERMNELESIYRWCLENNITPPTRLLEELE